MTTYVLSVASEAYPLIKTGGLADVAGALPAAVKPYGVEITTMLPGYPAVMAALEQACVRRTYDDLLGAKARLLRGLAGGRPFAVLDAPALFARDGGPYADPNGQEWSDNWLRFAALGKAAADYARDGEFDVLHAHDWQGGLAPAYLRYAEGSKPRAVMTIHNIAFPGWFPADIFPDLRLPPDAFAIEGVEYYGGVGFLKAGLQASDLITTVSPSYAEEIREPAFGMGLEGLIAARKDRVIGILNGIDAEVWNPSRDGHLATTYNADQLERRAENRRAAASEFRLTGDAGPIFCVISRLTAQKGMDLLSELADTLVGMGGRLALLGTGDPQLEAAFTAAAERHPGRIGVRIGYDEKIAHLLQGGSDAILIPSRFEPCGLTQLYGLRYGCVPVAARTGGLADTIIDANDAALAAGTATGFLFDGGDADCLARALRRAIDVFGRKESWRRLQKRGMETDHSWVRSGRSYADAYRWLLAGRDIARATA